MKKLLAVLLVFVLMFSFAACGGNDSEEGAGAQDNEIVENNDGEENGEEGEAAGTGSGSGSAGQVLNPDDLFMSEENYSSMEDEYDFGWKAEADFAFAAMVEQVEYSDISMLASQMEARLGLAQFTLGSPFAVFSEYEEIEGDEIDKLAYAIGMENDDTEGIFLETGVYHAQSTGKHYQYVTYCSRSYYEASSANTDTILANLKDAMGITISKKKLQDAIDKALARAEETENYYSLIESETAAGSGYAENITVSVDAFATEDNVIGYYVSCERERCYE